MIPVVNRKATRTLLTRYCGPFSKQSGCFILDLFGLILPGIAEYLHDTCAFAADRLKCIQPVLELLDEG